MLPRVKPAIFAKVIALSCTSAVSTVLSGRLGTSLNVTPPFAAIVMLVVSLVCLTVAVLMVALVLLVKAGLVSVVAPVSKFFSAAITARMALLIPLGAHPSSMLTSATTVFALAVAEYSGILSRAILGFLTDFALARHRPTTRQQQRVFRFAI